MYWFIEFFINQPLLYLKYQLIHNRLNKYDDLQYY